jgi:hypothetical protein
MRKLKGSLTIAGQLILKIAQNYYLEERYLTLMGRNKRHEIIAFTNADLNGSYDIRLEIGSAFNTSAAAKIEGLLSLWKEQVLQEAEKGSKAARKILEALEFGLTEDIYQMESAQEIRAQWVLDKIIEERKVPKIMDWENMDSYINVWREMMLSGDYMEKDEDLQRLLEDQMRWFIEMKAGQQKPQPEQGGEPSIGDGGAANNLAQTEQASLNQGMAVGPGDQGGQEIAFPEEGMNA